MSLIVTVSKSQINLQSSAMEEAKKRNITSVEEAIEELNKNGISISQATNMAQMQGIDLETFLERNFINQKNPLNFNDSIKRKVIDRIELSENIESNFNQKLNPNVNNEIESNYFGYSIFENNPFANKDYLIGNIDEGYLLSPGDEIRITIFGNNALNTETKIDLNGNIVFPQLGVFQAAGNSLKTLKTRLKIFLGKFYNGLVSSPQKTFIDISLTQIRPVNVTILGNAKTPGPHLVNGFASVLNALYAAGGIDFTGSLRKIILYRNNKFYKEFDLYDYITSGNIDSDVRLMNSDVIFIPPRISSVTLNGFVSKPAIYELKDGETLEDLIEFSGGFKYNSSTRNINLSRTTPVEKRDAQKKYNTYLSTLDFTEDSSIVLVDGDILDVLGLPSKVLNQVTIEGNVKTQGTFSVSRFPNLKSLINDAASGILPDTYREKVDIIKIKEDGSKSFKTYNLNSVMNDKFNVELEQDDLVRIYSLNDVEGERLVSVSGYGIDPKSIFWRENLSIFDILFQSTSFEELDFQSKVLRTRLDVDSFNPETGNYITKKYSLNNIVELKKSFLKPRDQIRLYSKSIIKNINPTISVLGSVQNPRVINLNDKMFVEDAILKAGGFAQYANKKTVSVIRKLKFSLDNSLSTNIVYNIDNDYLLGLSNEPISPLFLDDDDIIVVRTPNRDGILSTLNIEGEVNNPGIYPVENINLNLNKLIQMSGGLSNFANLNSTQFFRSGKLLAYKNKNQLLKQRLYSEDLIIIGSELDDVNVEGSGIINPTAVTWKPNSRVNYYLNIAGNLKKRILYKYVERKNGSSVKIRKFLSNPIIYPGDTIVVSQKPEKEKSEKTFQDDFTRIFSLITGTITTILLIDKL